MVAYIVIIVYVLLFEGEICILETVRRTDGNSGFLNLVCICFMSRLESCYPVGCSV